MKRWMSILLCAMMVLSMAACGGGGASDAAPTPDAGGSEAASADTGDAAASTGDTTEVVFYTWWADAERALGEALIADFEEKNPDIKVQQNYIAYNDYLSKMNTMVAAGSTPDVFYLNEYLITDWGEKGVGADLMPFYQEAGIDPTEMYVDNALYRSGDSLWGVNFTSTTTCLYYNKDMFTEAGIELPPNDATAPWSWDAFVDAAKKLTKDGSGNAPGDAGFSYDGIVQYGTVMPTSWIYVLPLLYAGGSSVANDDGTALEITKEPAIEIIQSIADLAAVEQVAPTVSVTQSNNAFASLPVMLMNGQLGMFVGGTFQFSDFANEDYDVGIAQIPSMSGTGSNMAWSSGFMMGADASPEAFKLYEYLLDFNNSVEAAKNHGVGLTGLPQTRSTFDDPDKNAAWVELFDPTMAEVAGDILNNGSRTGENVTLKNFSVIMDQTIVPQLDKVWLGEMSAADALTPLDEVLAGELQGVWG